MININNILKVLIAIIGIGIIILIWMLWINPVRAWETGVTCHKVVEKECMVHTYQQNECPEGWQSGACQTPSPSPSKTPKPSPTATPSPSPTPCVVWYGEFPHPCPTASPTPTPSETPAPSETPSPTPGLTDAGGAGTPPGVCQGHNIVNAPTITSVSRVDANTIHAEWTPSDAGVVSDYKVLYGLSGGNLSWSVMVHGLSVNIGDLPANHVIWLKVFPTDGCVLGPPSELVDP